MDTSLEKKREILRMIKKSESLAKPDACILCEKPKTSFCNSHSVPRTFLKNIACDGILLQAKAAMGFNEIETLQLEKGVNNSGTFQFICEECDHTFFRDYEEEQLLLYSQSDTMLAEIAVKNIIQMLSLRAIEIEMYRMLGHRKGCPYDADGVINIKNIDIREYREDLMIYREIIDQGSSGNFKVLFRKVLPYRVPIATQSIIAVGEDMEGRTINDVFVTPENNRIQSLHLCVFPLSESSVVLAFYHKRNKKYRYLLHQFNSSSEERKLEFINYLVFKYTENYFISKEIQQTVLESVVLKKLGRENIKEYYWGLITHNKSGKVKPSEIPNLLTKKCSIARQ